MMKRAILSVAALCVLGACDGDGAGLAGPHPNTDSAVPFAGDLPCEVEDALDSHCLECHTNPPLFGAPMPLVTRADLLAPSISAPSRPVYELVAERIHDTSLPMPPGGRPLPDADRAVLTAWAMAGAPEATAGQMCTDAGVPDGGSSDGGGSDAGIGPAALPCTPSHTFLAHDAPGSDGTFHVPSDAGNLYMCYAFRSPFAVGEQITAFAPVVGDARVLHHWILYRVTSPQTDGAVFPCPSMPAGSEFLMGWAPGGQNAVMPPDVGLEAAGPDEYLVLQVHYWNVAGHADADDRSGVAMCSTPTPRANTAGVIWLGSTAISLPPRSRDQMVENTCPSSVTALLPEPLHILSTFPHMHNLGTSIRTDILRGGDPAASETLVDVPRWDFNNQTLYWNDPAVTLNPGDALRTRCVYDNPGDTTVPYGEATEDEMCFNFLMAYPIEAVGGNRICIF